MRYFYEFMLRLTEFELAIAKSTGRNPEQIRALTRDRMKWLQAVQLDEVKRRYVK